MRMLSCLFLFTLSLGVSTAVRAPAAEEKVKIDDKTKKAMEQALEWLKDTQNKDGSWGNNSAITSFVLLAYMSQGHLPGQGKYGPEVAKGVRNLVAGARESDGYLVGNTGGNMYAHGMATLALSQVWGMTGDEEVKKVLKKAVDLICKTQNHEGGWRYEPQPTGADVSVTIMQVMALRGAKDSGLHVPDDKMKNAIKYIDNCRDARTGGYRYQVGGGPAGYARTAAGVCVLQLCGEYDKKDIANAVKYLDNTGEDRQHWWYGAYYAAHAYHQVGGKEWEAFYDKMKTKLLGSQQSNGSWKDPKEGHVGPAYQTAIAILILSVPSHYLPIYQR